MRDEEMFEFPKIVITPEALMSILGKWREELSQDTVVIDEINRPDPIVLGPQPILVSEKDE